MVGQHGPERKRETHTQGLMSMWARFGHQQFGPIRESSCLSSRVHGCSMYVCLSSSIHTSCIICMYAQMTGLVRLEQFLVVAIEHLRKAKTYRVLDQLKFN